MARTITLEERASVIRAALRSAPQIVLQELLSDVRDRIVIAVTFLAILELAKGREVTCRAGRAVGTDNGHASATPAPRMRSDAALGARG